MISKTSSSLIPDLIIRFQKGDRAGNREYYGDVCCGDNRIHNVVRAYPDPVGSGRGRHSYQTVGRPFLRQAQDGERSRTVGRNIKGTFAVVVTGYVV